MKRTLSIFALWILALTFMLWNCWAQPFETRAATAEELSGKGIPIPSSSEYRQPGDVLVHMANSTNAVMVPVVEKVQSWLQVAQNWLTGAATLIAALLAWWGKKGNDRAATLPVLIRAIENFDSEVLKSRIKADAKDKGVYDSLHEAVRENTSVGKAAIAEPFDYKAALEAEVKREGFSSAAPPQPLPAFPSVSGIYPTPNPPTPEIKPI